jgi:Ca2+-binding EF-hand superfamily protein
MINRRFLMAKLGSCSLLAMNAMFFSSSLAWAVPSAIEAFDKDDDGTLDLAEVKEAAGKMFDKLDKDGDGTLDSKEVGPRLSNADFKAADADHDGTLTKDEYFTIVEKLFNGADVDKDGTLSAKELQSNAGRALLRQIQ